MSKVLMIIGVTVLAEFWFCAPMAFAEECSKQEGFIAEAAAENLDTWKKVARARKRLASCDDGGVAEGFSDAVARLLARQWAQVPALVSLIHSQPELEPFVLAHLNESDDLDDLKTIRTLAIHRCPPTATNLCAKLVHRIDSLDLSAP